MWCRALAAGVLAALLSACGGGGGAGGGAGGGTNTRQALPALSEDTLPAGTRIDLRTRNYFPMSPGDTWTYDRVSRSTASGLPFTRSIAAAGGSDVVLTEAFSGNSENAVYRRTAEGVLLVSPLGTAVPAAVTQRVGDLLEYPEPFYPLGGVRRVVRQGSWGADQDGDGIAESFRFEYSQELVAFVSMSIGGRALDDIAHFRARISLTLQPSDSQRPIVTVVGNEDTWWAPGIGLVKAERSIVDGAGVEVDAPYTITIVRGVVGGTPLFGAAADGTLIKVALTHNALLFDARRNRYLASIPGSVVGNGNSIAAIDTATGAVTYSTAIGSEPTVMALGAGGDTLFVGLAGTGEVLKLRLPDLAVQWRVRLPTSTFGQLYAERIAASPIDADVVAVSMYRANISPRHGGVALIRGGALQPSMTQDHTGSNLIAFDGNGQAVYGFNNETTEFGLRRLSVLADGLREEAVVPALGNFGTRTLDWANDKLVLDKWIYRSPDLVQQGQVNVQGGGCRPHTVPNRLVCNPMTVFNSVDGQLAVVDATSFVVLSVPYFQRGPFGASLGEIVPGASGQVAMRMSTASITGPVDAVWLFDSSTLR